MNRLSSYIIFFGFSVLPLQSGAEPEDDVLAATHAWASAYNSHEVADVLARYHEDAVFWGTGSPTIRDEPAELREYFSSLTNRPNAHVEIGEYRVRVFGDIALNSGIYTFTDIRDGVASTRPARFSFAYRLVNDEWMIIDHHSSLSP
ncbi:MAG: DUF4440 domain-containing protein [SAR86 cluster bacterium]|uniref:DUF4440 domain-containing protein n=1 Tax=SAR86 cluster bacterium TaxID=2030880 RepID=A0A2A5CBN8_9GAMM|nr:MAG: DUF4440 domain-containing protein [SAR86 cluster bacterium]